MITRQRLSLHAYIKVLKDGAVSLQIATRRCSPVEVSQWQSVAAARQEALSLGCSLILFGGAS